MKVEPGLNLVSARGLVRVRTDRGDVTLQLSPWWAEKSDAAIQSELESCARCFAVDAAGEVIYSAAPAELLDRIPRAISR